MIDSFLNTIISLIKVIVILFITNFFMGEIFKWFIGQPRWLKLAIISFIFCFIFWFPFVDHFFKEGATELPWYKSLLYAFIPSTIWYLLALAQLYYVSYLLGDDLKMAHKDNMLWVFLLADVVIWFIVLAVIVVVSTSNWKIFLAVLFGYKILGFFTIKPFLKALDS